MSLETSAAAPDARTVESLDAVRQLPEQLGLAQEIVISIPTQREIEAYY